VTAFYQTSEAFLLSIKDSSGYRYIAPKYRCTGILKRYLNGDVCMWISGVVRIHGSARVHR